MHVIVIVTVVAYERNLRATNCRAGVAVDDGSRTDFSHCSSILHVPSSACTIKGKRLSELTIRDVAVAIGRVSAPSVCNALDHLPSASGSD
jgi:hypothetical protein